jgi:hypothetical protein
MSLTAAFAALILTGCGTNQPLRATFDSLTNETSSRASDLFDYNTFISLSGLVPQNGAQLIYHQPHFYDFQGNSPTYAVGISPTRSFISEHKFAMRGQDQAQNADTVRGIRDNLDSARLKSIQLTAARTRYEAAKTLIAAIGAGTPDATQTDMLKTLLGDAVVGDDGKVVAAKLNDALKRIDTEQQILTQEIPQLLIAAKDKAAGGNVVITRWARDSQKSLGGTLSEVFAFSHQSHEAKSGVLVFGDLRVVTLHSGEDLVDLLRSAPKRLLAFVGNAGITTFSIQAKHMAYSADLDMQRAIAQQLHLTHEQLARLSDTFKNLDLNYTAGFGVSMDVSNAALLTGSTVRTEFRCFFPPEVFTDSIQREIASSNGYQDLYIVRAQIRNELLDAAPRTHTALSDIAEECSTGKGKEAKLHPAASDACKTKFADWLAGCYRAPPAAIDISGKPLAFPTSITPSPFATFGAEPAARLFDKQPYIR